MQVIASCVGFPGLNQVDVVPMFASLDRAKMPKDGLNDLDLAKETSR